jgi:death-on-curing protein
MILLDEVLLIHKLGIKRYGGSDGLRDESALLSAIQRPFQTFDGKDLYRDAYSKAAAAIESILINHPFVDGNKRTGFALLLIRKRRHRNFGR